MRIETSGSPARYTDWLPRAIVSGFAATIAMATLFFLAYGFARILTNVELSPRPGAATFNLWLAALTSNRVLDLASTSIYAAGALHLVVGVLWAIAYGHFFEPRLPGTAVARGMMFSLIPWILSLVIFLPLIGGGFLGLDTGAGPLPAIGNLILHLGYGATLGVVYGPLGDVPADFLEPDAPEVADHYEMMAARGIVLGALIGLAIGIGGVLFHGGQSTGLVLGMPALAFIPVTVALGATFGGVLGSFGGMSGQGAPHSGYPARR